MKDVFVVRKQFFDDLRREEARTFYAAELARLAALLTRIPLDTDDWQGLQRDFNDIRVRMEVVQLLAYLITGDNAYNKNVLIQRNVTKPPGPEEFVALLDEIRTTVYRWPVEKSFQRNNVLLARIHYLNKIRIED